MLVVAIDIGGTFTDLIGFDDADRRFVQAKSLTTPALLGQGVIDCIRKSALSAAAVDELIHGSTIAINTLIERKGAKTGLVVTRGTRDVYIIGRGNRPEAYSLFFHRHRPLVPRHLTREVDERLLSSGEVHVPVDRAGIAFIPYDQAYEAGFEDMQRRRPDISKIKALIGWEPRISLEQTLARVIESLRPTSPARRGDAIDPR